MLTAIVYTLQRRIGGSVKIERERKACLTETAVNRYCMAMSNKYQRAAGVLIEVYDDQDQIVASHIV